MMTALRSVRVAMDTESARITVLFALMVLMLQISTVVTDSHRTKRLAEAVCNPGTTKILSPKYYRENSPDWCGSAAGLLNGDSLNMAYRQECQRWLGGPLPDRVDQAQLSYCFEYEDTTVLYRMSICCEGEPVGLRCFNGQREVTSWSSTVSASLNYELNYDEQLVTCQSDEVCQNSHTFEGKRGRIKKTTVAKGCAKAADCEAVNDPDTGTCKNCAVETPSCTTCCNTPFCNFDHAYVYKRPGDCSLPCDSRPCQNGGTCRNSEYDSISETYENYVCYCTVFWGGRNCEDAHPVCTNKTPCLNGGTCYDYDDIAADDYRCVCPPPFFGDNCELQNSLTCNSSDSNYWIRSSSSEILTFLSFSNNNCTPLASYVYDYPERVVSSRYFLQQLCGAVVGEQAASYRIEFQLQSCSRGTLYGLANYHSCCFQRSQCATNPCLNGGTCYDYSDVTPGDYRCECPAPFIGDLCELKIGLTCNTSDQYYVARPPSFYGYYTVGSAQSCTSLVQVRKDSPYPVYPYNDVINKDCRNSIRGQNEYQFVQGVDGQIKRDRFEFEATYCSRNVHSTLALFHSCCPTCLSSPCQNDGYCQQKTVHEHVCKCRVGFNGKNCENRLALCVAFGDPHYKTFDDKFFSYQGTSRLNLASPCNDSQPYFKVYAKNENRPYITPSPVSWPMYVEIDLGPNKVIRLLKLPFPFLFMLNGQLRFVPYVSPDGDWVVFYSGRYTVLMTDFGLTVAYDGGWAISVQIPVTLNAGQMCGMCGNNDGVPENDLTMADGTFVGDSPDAGNLVGDSHALRRKKRQANTECDPIPQHKERCQLINKTSGIFGYCIGLIGIEEASNFAAACIFDACYTNGSSICSSILTFVEICESRKATVPCDTWMTASNCPSESYCPDGMIFECSAPACLATCVDPSAPDFCPFDNTRACVCPEGELLHNGTCTSSCPVGCVDEHKQLYPVGESPGEGCTTVVCEECANCTEYQSPTVQAGCPADLVCVEDKCVQPVAPAKKPLIPKLKPCMHLKFAKRRKCLRRRIRRRIRQFKIQRKRQIRRMLKQRKRRGLKRGNQRGRGRKLGLRQRRRRGRRQRRH